MERTSRWHRANRKADIEEADGSSSSRQERVGIALSLLLEVNNLEIEELFTIATLACAEGVWVRGCKKSR